MPARSASSAILTAGMAKCRVLEEQLSLSERLDVFTKAGETGELLVKEKLIWRREATSTSFGGSARQPTFRHATAVAGLSSAPLSPSVAG